MWFVWDADDGFRTYETEEEAKAAAEHCLELWRECAERDCEWPEEVEHLCYGKITHEVQRITTFDDSNVELWDFRLDARGDT